ncbi:MAG: adenylosuccinate lyase [Saprospiraceae bacterium]
MAELTPLTSISPIDGRYAGKTADLRPYFSEHGLIQYRVKVELEYLKALYKLGLPQLAGDFDAAFAALTKRIVGFSESDSLAIKAIEKTTNHDVKAVEYWLKEQAEIAGLGSIKEFIHFGLTSQDINNTAVPWSLMDALADVLNPLLGDLVAELRLLVEDWADVPMLARTHGQPASPTRLGKEFDVFVSRLDLQMLDVAMLSYPAKFGGATGNFNAHHVAYPETDWVTFAEEFVESLGLERSAPTTQIEHYDGLAAICHVYLRICTILMDMCQDIWQYVSMEYFKQKTIAGEVGSSAMPHKVNPIDFENAEGNLGIARALFSHLAAKLPISRQQRDLTDSTVLRNLGVPFAHIQIAVTSIRKGLGKLELNKVAFAAALESNWMVTAEGIQTVLRREGYPQPYEALKALTRGHSEIGETEIHAFIDGLDVSDDLKTELKAIRPENYVGV